MPRIQIIGANGEISLGRKNAGRAVVVDQVEEGVWRIKAAVIPENERWLHTPEMKAKIDRALAWMATHEPKESDLDELERRLQEHWRRREKVAHKK